MIIIFFFHNSTQILHLNNPTTQQLHSDGLGYHDDGEEHYHDDDDEGQFAKTKSKKSGKNAALTKDALRRARRSKEMASAGAGNGEDGDGSGGGKKGGGGMWDFVNRGVGGAAAAAAASRKSSGGSASASVGGSGSGSGSGSSRSARSKIRGGGGGGGGSNLDDLLGDLDDSYPTPASSSARRRAGLGGGGASKSAPRAGGARRSVYGSSSASRGGARGGARGGGRARYQQEQQQRRRPVESHQFDDDDDAPMPFADDDGGDDRAGNMDVEPSPVKSTGGTAAVVAVGEKRKAAADADDAGEDDAEDASSPSSKKVSFQKSNVDDDAAMEVGDDDNNNDAAAKSSPPAATSATATRAPPRRRQFAKARVGSKMSAPLRAAMEARRAQQAARVARVAQASSANVKQEGAAKSSPANLSTTAPRALDAHSASFRPDVIEGESNQSDETKAAAAANLESAVQTETEVEEGREAQRYLDLFWTDAREHPSRKGTILLFGKVEVNAAHNAKVRSKANKAAPPKQYVSCCVAVSGNSRNLFVLPRKKEEGGSDGGNEFESMMDVHTELKSVLQPACIPNREGASWGGKVVDRRYAFHDASVPRDATQYLKVVYDAQYPVPAEEVCRNGGRYFQKIFGAGASNLENFIIKRKRELFGILPLVPLYWAVFSVFIKLTPTISSSRSNLLQ